jgi:hypothetical protein
MHLTGPYGDVMRDVNELVKLENRTFSTDAQDLTIEGKSAAPMPEPESYEMLRAVLGYGFHGQPREIGYFSTI